MIKIDANTSGVIHDLVSRSSKITTVSHTHPDGDAVGSSVAMACWLKSLGKDVACIFPDSIGSNLEFIFPSDIRKSTIVCTEDPKGAEARIGESDLIFCLDFNAFNRTEGLAGMLASSKAPKILIDHHLSPDAASFDVCVSETAISSASELAYYVLMTMPETGGKASRLPSGSAKALMAGMTTDTNNFANSTYPSTLRMASELLDAGVDRDSIVAEINWCYGENRLRLIGTAMKDLMTITPDGVSYIILDKATLDRYDVREGDTEGLVNMPLAIRGVRMSIMLKQDEGYFRVSVRSKKGTSANTLAKESFNGGGHELAAGGKLFFPKDIASPEDAAAYIEKVTKEFFAR
ncbi:MAG: DHH family phosphoesterase [Bacteroidota bacterium]|nr:DHH family phosphoesterase [Bacteroidota bacterium]